MAGWTGLPATQATDWSQIDFYKQFWAATVERGHAINVPVVGLDEYDTPAVGCDVQYMGTGRASSPTDKFSIYTLQEWIEDNAQYFVASHDVDDIAMYTWASLKAAAGLDASGWTRKHPEGTSYGKCQPEDYFGPWLWNELKACLDLLVATNPNWAWNSAIPGGGRTVYRGDGSEADGEAAYNQAKAEAEADWHDTEGSGYEVPPLVFWKMAYSGGTWLAAGFRSHIHLQPTGAKAPDATAHGWSANYVGYMQIGNWGTFDAQGDGVVEDGWKAWSGEREVAVGLLWLPDRVSVFPPNTLTHNATGTLGYVLPASDQDPPEGHLVLEWNVPDGFTHY